MVWPAELGEGVGLWPSVVFDDTEADCELEPSEACGEATEGSQGMMNTKVKPLPYGSISSLWEEMQDRAYNISRLRSERKELQERGDRFILHKPKPIRANQKDKAT